MHVHTEVVSANKSSKLMRQSSRIRRLEDVYLCKKVALLIEVSQVSEESMIEVGQAAQFIEDMSQGWPEVTDRIATDQITNELTTLTQDSLNSLIQTGQSILSEGPVEISPTFFSRKVLVKGRSCA